MVRSIFAAVAIMTIIFLLLLTDFHWYGWVLSIIPFYAAFVALPSMEDEKEAERREWLKILTTVDMDNDAELERVLRIIKHYSRNQ